MKYRYFLITPGAYYRPYISVAEPSKNYNRYVQIHGDQCLFSLLATTFIFASETESDFTWCAVPLPFSSLLQYLGHI